MTVWVWVFVAFGLAYTFGVYWCNFAPQTRTPEYRKRWRRDRGLE